MTGLDQQLLRLPQMKTIQEALARGETPVLAVGLAQIHKGDPCPHPEPGRSGHHPG